MIDPRRIAPMIGPNTLQGTMQSPQQPATPDFGATAAPFDEKIAAAYKQLQTILPPDIDYQAKYQDTINEVQNRPTPEGINPFAAFAYALGSPKEAPGIMRDQLVQKHKEEEQKQFDLNKLKESMLQGAIQQEIAKGNFKTALSQADKLAEIQRINSDRDRALDVQQKEHELAVKQQNTLELQKQRANDAKALVRTRTQELLRNFNLPEKIRLAALDRISDNAARLSIQKDMFENFILTPEQAYKQAAENEQRNLESMGYHMINVIPPDSTTAPPVAETPRARQIRLNRENKGKK